jgi:hypothetical protein
VLAIAGTREAISAAIALLEGRVSGERTGAAGAAGAEGAEGAENETW